MKMLFPVILVLLFSCISCEVIPKWYGIPPTCQCFSNLNVIKCEDIRIFPRLTKEETKNTRILILTGQIKKLPLAILNRTVFPSLVKVNVMETNILCAEPRDGIVFVSRLCSSTTMSIITGKPPSETEADSGVTTDFIDTNITLMYSSSPYKTTATPWGKGLQWFTAGVTLTALNILAVVIITMCVVIRYRRMKNNLHGAIRLKHITGEENLSVETIGADLADAVSNESQELFVAPVPNRSFGLRSRRSMEKELQTIIYMQFILFQFCIYVHFIVLF